VTSWPRIAIAAAASGVAHVAVIAVGHIELPREPAELPPLAVRVESISIATNAPVPPRARAANALKLAAAPAPAIAVPAAQPGVVQSGVTEEAAAVEDPSTAEAVAPDAQPIVVAKAEPSMFKPELPPLRTLPRKGQITYNLVYGRDRFPVGRTVQNWQIDGTTYRIASASETTGIIDFFRSQHRNYLSRGSLTREGLRPESFLMSRNRGRGLEEARAAFDWADGKLTLGSVSEQRRETLPEGSQDLVSFVYQLAINPPQPGRMRVPVTNGNKIEVYQLDVLPEESIETPLGVLRALPLKQVRTPGEESIEVWLASEYRYLPVRVRFINRDGEPAGEQIVREIRLSDD
jgi:hypothetical protein